MNLDLLKSHQPEICMIYSDLFLLEFLNSLSKQDFEDALDDSDFLLFLINKFIQSKLGLII